MPPELLGGTRRALVDVTAGGVQAVLTPGATGSLLANRIIDSTGEWEDPLHGWLAGTGWDAALLDTRLRRVDDVVRVRYDAVGAYGRNTRLWHSRQCQATRWENEAVTGLVAACNATRPLRMMVGLLMAAFDRRVEENSAVLLHVVRDLITRGFLEIVRPDESSS